MSQATDPFDLWGPDPNHGRDVGTLIYAVCLFVIAAGTMYLIFDVIPNLPNLLGQQQQENQQQQVLPNDPQELQRLADRLRARRVPAPDPNDACSICLGPHVEEGATPAQQLANLTLELLPCAHEFCCGCLLELLGTQFFRRSPKCPNCRGDVALIVPSFRRHPQLDPATVTASFSAHRELRDFNGGRHMTVRGIFAAFNFVSENFMRLPFVLRLRLLVLVLLVVVYVVSPLDLISEAHVGLIGYVDDLLVMVLAFVVVFSLLRGAF